MDHPKGRTRKTGIAPGKARALDKTHPSHGLRKGLAVRQDHLRRFDAAGRPEAKQRSPRQDDGTDAAG